MNITIMDDFTKELKKPIDTADPFASPLIAINATEWREQERLKLLGAVLPRLKALHILLIIVTTILGLHHLLWYNWSIVAFQILGYILHRRANHLYKQQNTVHSSYFLLASGVMIMIPATFIYQEMVVNYITMGLLYVFLTNMLLSSRAGRHMAIMLTIFALQATLANTFSLYDLAPPINPEYFMGVNIIIFPATLFIGNDLMQFSNQSTARALNQLITYSQQLQEINQYLGDEIISREETNRQRTALTLEQERNQMMTSFIQDASHEFCTPLTVINTSLYLLNRGHVEPPQKKWLENIQTQTTLMTQLVDSLLEMARLDSGAPFNINHYSINELLIKASNGFDSSVRAQFQFQFEEDIPLLAGDIDRLGIAMQNLLQNAVDHSPSDSPITMQTTHEATTDTVVITIMDQGEGIPAEILPHIFERFYRGDPARTRRGVGLGLPIAKKTIDTHQGNIDIQSTLGEGTTVIITLPASKTPRKASIIKFERAS